MMSSLAGLLRFNLNHLNGLECRDMKTEPGAVFFERDRFGGGDRLTSGCDRVVGKSDRDGDILNGNVVRFVLIIHEAKQIAPFTRTAEQRRLDTRRRIA